mmetsp:Transcript_11814/g.12724  ORF Transcript_11814/g.12724 Transcript_11814/m.12724 type:complete len:345 (-) Transcript_11814:175-1209(-)
METFDENIASDPVETITTELVKCDESRLEFDEECPREQPFIEDEVMRSSDRSVNAKNNSEENSVNMNLLLNASIRKLIQLILLTILALALALFIFVWPRNFGTERNTALIYDGKHRKTYNGKPAYQVLLTGDSLNLRPWQYHNLGGRIQDHLPTIALFFKQESLASYTLANLNDKIRKQIKSQPDFAFICGDTDVSSSGNDEWKMKSEKVQLNHKYYQNNMTTMIHQLRQGVTFFAFSGPFLLGEHKVHPVFYDITSQRIFNNKHQQLGNYVEMNRKVCEAEGVKYINMHKIFSHQLPRIWPFASWYVTADGEHPNQYGTILMAREYALAIKEWLKLPDSAWRD